MLIWCLLVRFFFSFPLFVKTANFLSVLVPFSLLHCFAISCSTLYEQIVGCESSRFSLWHTERSIAILISLCLLRVYPNYRQVTAETLLSKETGFISLTPFRERTQAWCFAAFDLFTFYLSPSTHCSLLLLQG